MPTEPDLLTTLAVALREVDGIEIGTGVMWGISWDRPVRRLGEFLDGLLPLLAGEKARAAGEIRTTSTPPGRRPPGSSRSTGSCRPTARCSTARASPAPRTPP